MKVKKIDLAIWGMFIAISKPSMMPQTLQQIIKVVLLMLVIVFLFKRVKLKNYLNPFGLMCLAIVLSGILSFKDGVSTIDCIINGMLHALVLMSIWGIIFYCKKINYIECFVKDMFSVLSVYCLLSIVSMIIRGHSDVGGGTIYFWGTKFTTSYYFILWLTFFRLKYANALRRSIIVRFLYSLSAICIIVLCGWMYCATGMIGAMVIFAEQFIPEKVKKIFFNRYAVLFSMILSGIVFPISITQILSNPKIQFIIRDIFHKSSNLTGRKVIIENMFSLILERPWFGYGYSTTVMHTINQTIDNAQNGLLQQLIQFGVVGGVLLCFVVFLSLNSKCENPLIKYLYTSLYAMIICSMVEISYNYVFYIILFTLGSYSINSKQQMKTI